MKEQKKYINKLAVKFFPRVTCLSSLIVLNSQYIYYICTMDKISLRDNVRRVDDGKEKE